MTAHECQILAGMCILSGDAEGHCRLVSAWDLGSQISDQAIERAAELRAADRSRCRHRSIEPLRHEPCVCPVISSLPIYCCDCPDLLDADGSHAECSDLRQPRSPATFCGDCLHRKE